MPPARTLSLETPLRGIPGVGTARVAQLTKLQLLTVGDLLLHRPRRYEDRRHVLAIRDLQLGEATTTRGATFALPEMFRVLSAESQIRVERSADILVCCIADIPVGWVCAFSTALHAGDDAGWKALRYGRLESLRYEPTAPR